MAKSEWEKRRQELQQNVTAQPTEEKPATMEVPGTAGVQGFLSGQWQQHRQSSVQPYAEALGQGESQATYETALKQATAEETPQENPYANALGQTTAATENVTYIDDNGEKQTGVVTATPEETPTEEAPKDYWGRLEEMYSGIYADALAANEAQAAAATERAKAAEQEQLAALAAQYAGTNRQLYRDYMMTQKALPQQMAAQGYSGGMSESARLRLGTSYQEALAENERARIAAAAGISSEQAQNIYEIEAARAEADRQAAAQQNQYLLAMEQERQQYALAQAETMAAAGDFSGYLELGYSQDEVDYLTRLWLAQNPGAKKAWIKAHPEDAKRLGIKATSSSSSSSGGSGPGTTPTGGYGEVLQMTAVANEAIRNGATGTQVQAALGAMAEAGEISASTAQTVGAAISNPTAGLTTSELNAMRKN